MAQNKQKLRVVDNPAIVESYANKFVGASFDGSAVAVTFGTARFLPTDTSEPPKSGQHPAVTVTARIALSPDAAVELVNALRNMLNHLQAMRKAAREAAGQTSH